MTVWTRWRQAVLDLLFPKKCLICSREGAWLCAKCRPILRPRIDLLCPICQRRENQAAVCSDCRAVSFLDGLWVLADYRQELIKKIIHGIKYDYFWSWSELFDLLIADYFRLHPAWSGDFILAPVPLHRHKQQARGFNQAELICQSLQRLYGNQIAGGLLSRVVDNQPQVSLLSADKRRQNMSGVFVFSGREKIDPRATIVLVDDVYTTGATMQECAKIIKQNGLSRVWGLAVARG